MSKKPAKKKLVPHTAWHRHIAWHKKLSEELKGHGYKKGSLIKLFIPTIAKKK